MRRAGAILVAVAMVVGAFVIRDRVTGDDAATGPGGAALLCPTELEEICREVTGDLRVEGAGATADRLLTAESADDLGADAWLVPVAWARLVIDERARLDEEALFTVSRSIASTAIVLVAWTEPAEALRGICGTLDWNCVAEHSGSDIGGYRIKAGGPPTDSASGLAIAAAQTADLLGSSDFASQDFDPELRALVEPIASGVLEDALREVRVQGPGLRSAIGATAVEAANLTSPRGRLVYEPLSPEARVDLVLLTLTGHGSDLHDEIEAAAVAAGWSTPTDEPDGLPENGSVLAAVRTLWKEHEP